MCMNAALPSWRIEEGSISGLACLCDGIYAFGVGKLRSSSKMIWGRCSVDDINGLPGKKISFLTPSTTLFSSSIETLINCGFVPVRTRNVASVTARFVLLALRLHFAGGLLDLRLYGFRSLCLRSKALLCISESSQFRVLLFDPVAFDCLCYRESSSSLIHVRWLGTNMGARSCSIRSFVLSSVSPLCPCTADL